MERDVRVGERVLRVRVSGDPGGSPVLYFHGTPGSRLDLAFDDVVARAGVRLVAFDRPGYGGSTPARFGLRSVAADAAAVADALDLERFTTLGWSGGGPYALATAAVLGERVLRVGVLHGAAPFSLPGAPELSEDDREGLAHLPHDPEAASACFARDFRALRDLVLSSTPAELVAALEPVLPPADRELLSAPRLAEHLHRSTSESLRTGVDGAAWDNVAWVGAWDLDLADVRCPVLLWYADEDRMAPVAFGRWLSEALLDAVLSVRVGEGHFGPYVHLADVLDALTAPLTPAG